VLIFVHPQGTAELKSRLAGQRRAGKHHCNPRSDDARASHHLIFEGTLDRFPGLRSAPPHGGRLLPSLCARARITSASRSPSAARQSAEEAAH